MDDNKTFAELEAESEAKEKSGKKEKKPKKPPMTKEEKAAEKLRKKEEREKKKKESKNRPKDIKASAKRLFGYLRPYRGWLIFVGFLVVFSTVIAAVASVLMGPVFNTIEAAIKTSEDGGIAASEAIAKIAKYLTILVSIYVVSGVMTLAYNKIMLNVTQKLLNTLRRDLFNHLQSLPLGFFDTHKTGEIMSRFNTDVEAVNSLVSSGFISLVSAVLTLIITLTLMIYFSWKITLSLFGTVAVMLLVVLLITSRSSKLFKKQHKIMGEYNGYVEEYIRGQKCVKVFNHEKKVKEGYAVINEDYRKTGTKAGIISGLMSPLLSLISRTNYAISVGLGAVLVLNGKMTVGNLIIYIQYSQSFGSPIAQIAGQYNSLLSALAGAERIFEIIDTASEIDEGKVTLVNVTGDGDALVPTEEKTDRWAWEISEGDSKRYVELKGDVRFNGVDFQYKEGEPVLKNINLEALPGKKLAFVGSTGAGKTTITNLINRFYDIQQGMITYDGIDVKDIKKDSLRHSLAMVLQDTRLFTGTIEDNIRYGRLDATHEEIVEAAKVANAHSFIEKLPNGYDTELKTDGQNISAGQRQLISIARAAVADAPVLILDEATSSIDTRTERLIEVGMDSLMEGRTVFVIAHRLSTVRNSDDIIVLEQGEIIEEGDHAELIDKQGKYYQLYTGQFKLS